MITRIEARQYRCFSTVSVSLDRYQVLVGPNGSGKSTLLEIPRLLGDMIRSTPGEALLTPQGTRPARVQQLREAVHFLRGNFFSLVVEATLPEAVRLALEETLTERQRLNPRNFPHTIRYEVTFEIYNDRDLQVNEEWLGVIAERTEPDDYKTVQPIIVRGGGDCTIVRELEGNGRKGRAESYQLRPTELAFSSIRRDRFAFPAANFLRELLMESTVYYEPSLEVLRQGSPPAAYPTVDAAGRALPWRAKRLQETDPEKFAWWVAAVQAALPTVESIRVIEREVDHYAFLVLGYRSGYEVPSTGLSEGTLRILALTLLPYLDQTPSVLVVEEPETALHPQAIETILTALQSVYNSQVWVTTHSPIVLAQTKLTDLLVLRRDDEGEVTLTPGTKHPRLKEWQKRVERTDLGTLFASGVLS